MGRLCICYNSKLPWQRYCWSLSKQSHNASCQVRSQAKAPRVKLLQHFAILVFSKHWQLRPTLCDSCTHTHFDLSFLTFCLLSFIYFLYFLSPFLSYLLFIFFSFITSSFLPLPSFLIRQLHSFINSFIQSSFCIFYSVVTTTILYSFHPISFFFSLSWLKRPVVFFSRFKHKSRQTDSFQNLSYEPAHY